MQSRRSRVPCSTRGQVGQRCRRRLCPERPLRILIVSQYFWPESFGINDLARVLNRQGHSITVATGKPNYPEGRVFHGYTADGFQKERFADAIDVYRVPLRPRYSGGLNLFRNYLSFVWSGLRWFPLLLKNQAFDVILVYAPSPIISAVPAIPLKWSKKAHLAIWVQDLWPESLAGTGYIRNRGILTIVGWLVRWIYRRADTLLVPSEAFVAAVSAYGRAESIVYYGNSIDIESTPERVALQPELLDTLRGHFCIVFAGNVGTAQDVETIVEAAARIKDLSDVRMVVVGSGSRSQWLRDQQQARVLHNLVIAGRYPRGAMPEIYQLASALLVTLKDEKIYSYTVPSKLQAYLAAGRPIIAALNGEGARIVAEAGAGLTCAAEDADELVKCVRTLHAIPVTERARMGASGHRYFLDHFEINAQARRLVDVLQQRMEKDVHN